MICEFGIGSALQSSLNGGNGCHTCDLMLNGVMHYVVTILLFGCMWQWRVSYEPRNALVCPTRSGSRNRTSEVSAEDRRKAEEQLIKAGRLVLRLNQEPLVDTSAAPEIEFRQG